jgi:hypothetical protein
MSEPPIGPANCPPSAQRATRAKITLRRIAREHKEYDKMHSRLVSRVAIFRQVVIAIHLSYRDRPHILFFTC